jgi:hypothetical protein
LAAGRFALDASRFHNGLNSQRGIGVIAIYTVVVSHEVRKIHVLIRVPHVLFPVGIRAELSEFA